MIGKTLGHYRVGEQLGRGGMGEVYVADDLNLNRKVALKFLPEAFTGDPERMARFEREAKLLASLNHPNIAAIYGLEQTEGKRFLVLELVEGETLAQRLVGAPGREPLQIDETLGICRQIAEGLEAAHEKGVIHRDLKPANVMITEGDKVKILDFGLAKALSDETQIADSSQSPTLTEAMTRPGVILGTAAYMSPEQAKGKSVDKRADIWAFGCILYECLTGKRVFEGETVTETLAAILKGQPDWEALPETTSPNIRFVLLRCLEKDLGRRFHDVADVRIEIEEARNSGLPAGAPGTALAVPSGWRRAIPLGIAALLAAIATGAGVWILKPSPSSQSVIRFSLADLEDAYPPWLGVGYYRQFALSPDGRKLALVIKNSGGSRLAIRSLDSLEVKILANTDGAVLPFWSPDGQSVAFFTVSPMLKKVSLSTGGVTTICRVPIAMGGSWGAADEIAYTGGDGIWRVPAAGGTPQHVMKIAASEFSAFPCFLDDGRRIVFSHWTRASGWRVEATSIDGEPPRPLVKAYVAEVIGDVLVFLQQGGLFRQAFDVATATLRGRPVRLDAGEDTQGYLAGFSFSATGILAYQRRAQAQLRWYDRDGRPGDALTLDPSCRNPELSPDGRQAAVECTETGISPMDVVGLRDIWTVDLSRGTAVRITAEGRSESDPAWSPDGTQIAFSSTAVDGKGADIYRTASSGGGALECVLATPHHKWIMSWWPGRHLIYLDWPIEALSDLSLSGDIFMLEGSRPQPVLVSPFNEGSGQLAPGSAHLLYDSTETGELAVYVKSLEDGRKWRISTGGGHKPRWRPDGSEIFYLTPDRTLVAVPVSWQSGFQPGRPVPLFKTRIVGPLFAGMRYPYAVTRDGQRFLMYVGEPSSPLAVVINAVP